MGAGRARNPVLLELGAQGSVRRHGFTLGEGLSAPVLDGVPEGSTAVPGNFKRLPLLLVGQNPDDVCSPHASVLAHLAATLIPILKRVGPSRGGFAKPIPSKDVAFSKKKTKNSRHPLKFSQALPIYQDEGMKGQTLRKGRAQSHRPTAQKRYGGWAAKSLARLPPSERRPKGV